MFKATMRAIYLWLLIIRTMMKIVVWSWVVFHPMRTSMTMTTLILTSTVNRRTKCVPHSQSVKKLVIVGGPQPRDTSGMTESEKEDIEREDRILRKKWTNTQRWKRLKKNKIGSPP